MATRPAGSDLSCRYHEDWTNGSGVVLPGKPKRPVSACNDDELLWQTELASLRHFADAMRKLASRDSDAIAERLANKFEAQAQRLETLFLSNPALALRAARSIG